MVEGTRIFALAESLGGVESLISVPALMTMPRSPRSGGSGWGSPRAGALSVGSRNVDDLIEDLDAR